MSTDTTSNGGRVGARHILVWDPLVRLIHWGLALTILLNATVIDEDSALHEWIGYIAVGLVCTRLIWGWIGSKTCKIFGIPSQSDRCAEASG